MNTKTETKILGLYFMIGGISALVEWATFAIALTICHYMIATVIAFVLATFVNYVLGSSIAFNNFEHKRSNIVAVYFVSGIGLLLNLILMFLFVKVFLFYEMCSKIIATGIVFFWNYISRRIFIYRKEL